MFASSLAEHTKVVGAELLKKGKRVGNFPISKEHGRQGRLISSSVSLSPGAKFSVPVRALI